MIDRERKYLAYMLRLWQTEHDGELVWRASIESPYTGERQGFADPERLFAFLEEKMRDQHLPNTGEHAVDQKG